MTRTGPLQQRIRRLLCAGVPLIALWAGCIRKAPEPPERDHLRVIIPSDYSSQIRELVKAGGLTLPVRWEDVDWVDMPSYSGRDAVFAPSLAARFEDKAPDADIYFVDLYRVRSFRPEWLTPFDEAEASAFRADFVEAARLRDGKVYALPWSAKGNFLFYRKDLIVTPPSTWPALLESCRQVAGKLPRNVRYCLLLSWESLQNDVYPMLWTIASGPPDLGSDAVVAFLTDLARAVGEPVAPGFVLLPPAGELSGEVGRKVHDRFAEGGAVYMINWNNRLEYMRDYAARQTQIRTDFRLPPTGLAPIPTVSGTGPFLSNIGSWGWIVPRRPTRASRTAIRRHELAVRLVHTLTSREAVAGLAAREGLLPARFDVPLPPELGSVLDPRILHALEGRGEQPKTFQFRDRGSDEFVHAFVRDALKDILTCRSNSLKPLPSDLIGRCVQYFVECLESGAATTEDACLDHAIRRRLRFAQREIERIADRSAR